MSEREGDPAVVANAPHVERIGSSGYGLSVSEQQLKLNVADTRGASEPWAWARCRSGFDWMDVHLLVATSEWF